MSLRILTLSTGDAWQYYAVCDGCGFLSMPFSGELGARESAERHTCRLAPAEPPVGHPVH